MPKAHPFKKRRGAKNASIKTPASSRSHTGESQRSTPGDNFREVLGLADNKDGFETLKKHLRNVMEKHLDWDLRWHEQTDATWENVDFQLRNVVPSIHETDERKRAARRYMATYFRNAKWNMEKQKLADEDRENNPPSDTPPRQQDPPAVEYVSIRKSTIRRSKRKPSSKPLKRTTSHNHASVQDVASVVSQQATRPFQSRSAIRHPSESSAHSDTSQTEEAIRGFLRVCQPSLEHLMPVFTRSTMDIKSLSLAFQIAEQYEAIITRRAGSYAE